MRSDKLNIVSVRGGRIRSRINPTGMSFPARCSVASAFQDFNNVPSSNGSRGGDYANVIRNPRGSANFRQKLAPLKNPTTGDWKCVGYSRKRKE